LYDRPVYKSQNPFDGWTEYVYYLGSRWNGADWHEDDFHYSYSQDVAAHAFWDNLFGSGFAFSEMTKSGLPLGLDWQVSSHSRSRGDFGPFLAHDPSKLAFQCIKNKCKGRDPCGEHGKCIHGKCVCNNCFGGYFCEYYPLEPYAETQFYELIDAVEGNGTISSTDYSDKYWTQIDDPEKSCLSWIYSGF
jgi:hypothetical protein